MILLRLSALICAATTMTLNAHYGFASSATLHYALLFTALGVAIDLAKCTLPIVVRRAWQARARLKALLAFMLFLPCFAYSLHAGVSEIARNRDAAGADAVAASGRRARAESEHGRLTAALATMEADRQFAAAAACAKPATREQRAFCARIAETRRALSAAAAILDDVAPVDPHPQLTLFAALTGWPMPQLSFALALYPILLAELCGSLGFYLGTDGTLAERQPRRRLVGWLKGMRRPTPNAAVPPVQVSAPRSVTVAVPTRSAMPGRRVWSSAPPGQG